MPDRPDRPVTALRRRGVLAVVARGTGLTTLAVVVVLLFTGVGASASTASGAEGAPSTVPLFVVGGVALLLLVVAHLLRRPADD